MNSGGYFMDSRRETVDRIIARALAQGIAQAWSSNGQEPRASQDGVPQDACAVPGRASLQVPVGVSNRHVHLSRADMDALFGPGVALRRKKAMKQPGQFAAEETVTIKGPKGVLNKVRVLGPLRPETQVEISVADGFTLGISPPLRMSGDLDDTPGAEIIGPCGTAIISQGVIVAKRHIHMHSETAGEFGVRNGDVVDVEGARGGVMREVVVRASEDSVTEMHVDVEEANAFCLHNDDLVHLRN